MLIPNLEEICNLCNFEFLHDWVFSFFIINGKIMMLELFGQNNWLIGVN